MKFRTTTLRAGFFHYRGKIEFYLIALVADRFSYYLLIITHYLFVK